MKVAGIEEILLEILTFLEEEGRTELKKMFNMIVSNLIKEWYKTINLPGKIRTRILKRRIKDLLGNSLVVLNMGSESIEVHRTPYLY